MGSHGRSWGRDFESMFNQHGRRGGEWSGHWGQWGQWGPPGRRSGPPPWLAGLFGLASGEQQRGPRVRRGDVRMAIVAVLADGPLNGYQVIGQIAERTEGAWRPSPGSVYPTISQLEDEGLIEGDDEQGRRTVRLTDSGRDYLTEHADAVAQVWAPFAAGAEASADDDGDGRGSEGRDFASLRPELGRVMNAVWQIITTGTDQQRREAIGVLVEARRGLYQILADQPAEDVSDRHWARMSDDPDDDTDGGRS